MTIPEYDADSYEQKPDPVCAIHGKRLSEHKCLYCCLCFASLTPDQCITRSNGTRVCAVCDAMERHGYDTRSKLADTRVKLAEIKKLWFDIENEFPDGIVFEVKDRTKFVNACAQLRYLLGDI